MNVVYNGTCMSYITALVLIYSNIIYSFLSFRLLWGSELVLSNLLLVAMRPRTQQSPPKYPQSMVQQQVWNDKDPPLLKNHTRPVLANILHPFTRNSVVSV
jgi:hypothetical protein